MSARRFTSQGTSYVLRSDPGRVRNDGSRLEKHRIPIFERVLCLAMPLATAVVIGVCVWISR